jgi:hypothetical protein
MGTRVLLITVVAAALGACGGAAESSVEVVRAAAAVRAAGEAGARGSLEAAGSLELAERELRWAQAQLQVGDVEGARSWAGRARADAGLSRMQAIEAATRGAAQRSEDCAQALSQALDERGSTGVGGQSSAQQRADAKRAP